MLMPENMFKPVKYNCAECTSEFHLLGDLIEHRNRFHSSAERYLNGGGEQMRPRSENGGETAANTAINSNQYEHDTNAEVKIEPKKENDCESEDEQIDVVTTKMEDDCTEHDEK